jgi:hypothetical protein
VLSDSRNGQCDHEQLRSICVARQQEQTVGSLAAAGHLCCQTAGTDSGVTSSCGASVLSDSRNRQWGHEQLRGICVVRQQEQTVGSRAAAEHLCCAVHIPAWIAVWPCNYSATESLAHLRPCPSIGCQQHGHRGRYGPAPLLICYTFHM